MPTLHGSGYAERHAYGSALFCISRRVYALIFCAVLSFVCILQLARLFLDTTIVHSILGHETLPPKACSGLECYEVFSCRGFAWTTDNIRKLLLLVPGAVLFPLGVHAAVHGYRLEMKLVSFYMMILSAVYFMGFIGDIIYFETCSAYSGNIIDQTLLWPIPFPLRRPQQDELATMTFFPMADVDKITHDFATMTMYSILETLLCVFLVYSTYEIMILAHLLERGPIGLGVHYGLGQFDEIINHEELQKRKLPRSKFVDDCKLPTYDDAEAAPLGYHVSHNYGAFYGESVSLAVQPSKDVEHWKEQNVEVKEQLHAVQEEVERAQEAHNKAVEVARHEQEKIVELERQAGDEAYKNEVSLEREQQRKAEELAQDAADDALAKAKAEGCPEWEARLTMARAYQHTLAKYHGEMLKMAKASALHSHFDHASREHHYREMHEEIVQAVEDTREELQKADLTRRSLQEQEESLSRERSNLQAAGLWQEREDISREEMGNPAEFALSTPAPEPMTPPMELSAGNTNVHNPYAITLPPGAFPHAGVAPQFNSYPRGLPIRGAVPTPSELAQVNYRPS